MHVVDWSENALDDVRGIIHRLAESNPAAAVKYTEHFRHLTQLIAFMPTLFKRWEPNPAYHCCALPHPYKILYRVSEERVIIVAVVHGRQQDPELR